jgi:hypothetical protein
MKKNVNRHGPRPLLNTRHFAEPPFFSLYTTFNIAANLRVWYAAVTQSFFSLSTGKKTRQYI